MAFSDYQEQLVEKAASIIRQNTNAITDDFTRFNTIYVGNISDKKINFEIQLMYPEMAKQLNFDLNRYYQDAYYNLEKTLEYRIWHHENIPDDSPFIGIYEMDYGVYAMDYAQLGMEIKWIENDYPHAGPPVILNEGDLDRIGVPDFFSSGNMRTVIENYHKLKEDLSGRMEIGIRKFFHGPTQFVCDAHGMTDFYIEVFENPDLVRKYYDYYMTFLHAWVRGWEKLHDRKYGMVHLAEDQLDTKYFIPPELFRDLILPYHKKLGAEFGSLHWHSCANIMNILEDIRDIPNLSIFECGPATDAYEAAKILQGTGVHFYKCIDPISELMSPVPGAQEKVIENVLQAGELVPIKILVETPSLKAGLKLLKVFRTMY